MKIVFLESTAQDIQCFRFHYRSVFPAGSAKTRGKMKVIQETLAANPYAGHHSDTRNTVREFFHTAYPFRGCQSRDANPD